MLYGKKVEGRATAITGAGEAARRRMPAQEKKGAHVHYPTIHFDIPEDVKLILDILNQAGYEAFAVGGCVRDVLLGRTPGDWDITTSAKPQEVKALFHRTIDTGIQHGTVTVMMHRVGYEVTTYRVDGEYEDGRHPKSVSFTASLVEDLKRRDFTINAMAYNPKTGVIDEFGGMEDMEKKVIRAVGCAAHRFTEDALRILRAVRFSAQLGFSIEEETKAAITDIAPNLVNVSNERIRVEMDKLICSNHPEQVKLLVDTKVTDIILSWLSDMDKTKQNIKYHKYNVLEHSIEVMKHVPAKRPLRWAALLHDVAKPACETVDADGISHFYGHQEKGAQMAKTILRELRFDNKTIDVVTRLVRFHDVMPKPDDVSVRQSIFQIGKDIYPLYLQMLTGDLMGKSDYDREAGMERIKNLENRYQTILKNQDCLSLAELAVTGADLIAEGFERGPILGEILSWLLACVLKEPEKNTKECLMKMAKSYQNK